MGIKFYRSRKTGERIEKSKKFAGSAPYELHVEPWMENKTLRQISRELDRRWGEKVKAGAGISVNTISFSIIFDPEQL